MNFATVGFIYNYPCPLKCNFCCHTKENVGEGRLHPGNVVPLILDFARYENVRRFAFTGGDPFVYIREILEIMRAARAGGVAQPLHMVTSGYWAKTDAKAQTLLCELAEVGMACSTSAMTTSTSAGSPRSRCIGLRAVAKSRAFGCTSMASSGIPTNASKICYPISTAYRRQASS